MVTKLKHRATLKIVVNVSRSIGSLEFGGKVSIIRLTIDQFMS